MIPFVCWLDSDLRSCPWTTLTTRTTTKWRHHAKPDELELHDILFSVLSIDSTICRHHEERWHMRGRAGNKQGGQAPRYINRGVVGRYQKNFLHMLIASFNNSVLCMLVGNHLLLLAGMSFYYRNVIYGWVAGMPFYCIIMNKVICFLGVQLIAFSLHRHFLMCNLLHNWADNTWVTFKCIILLKEIRIWKTYLCCRLETWWLPSHIMFCFVH